MTVTGWLIGSRYDALTLAETSFVSVTVSRLLKTTEVTGTGCVAVALEVTNGR